MDMDGCGQALDLVETLAAVYEDDKKRQEPRARFENDLGRFTSGFQAAREKLMLGVYLNDCILSKNLFRVR